MALATLTPSGGADARVFSLCVVCGTTGGADAVLNVLLFVPLGLVLGVRRGPLWALVMGLLVSAGIEVAQLWIPGRFSNLADLIWNGAGAGLGALLASTSRAALGEASTWAGRALGLGIPTATLMVLGLALLPLGSDARYVAEWTPVDPFMEPYHGRVLSASLNGEGVPDGPFSPGADPDSVLAGDWTLEALIVAGPPPPGLAAAIRMHAETGMLILGVDGQDLVWRRRRLARLLRLAYTDFYLRGALTDVSVGDTVSVGASETQGDLCMWAGADRACGVGLAPARSWRLLRTVGDPPANLLSAADLVWMGALFFPLGLLCGVGRGAAATVALGVGAVAMAVLLTPLVAPGWADGVGLTLGLLLGFSARPVARVFLEIGPSA